MHQIREGKEHPAVHLRSDKRAQTRPDVVFLPLFPGHAGAKAVRPMTVVHDRLRTRPSRPATPAWAASTRAVITRPASWLVVVGAAVTVVGVTILRHGALSWDETVYLSQTNPRTPALFFGAPRSRGVPVIVAP